VADYQSRLDAVPKRESDLVELTRDYATQQAEYQSLLTKQGDASSPRISNGETSARSSKSSMRPEFQSARSARTGCRSIWRRGSGTAHWPPLVGWLEYRDTTFKCEDDVARALDLRVLAQIPQMVSDRERRTRRWRLALFGVSAFMAVISGAAIVLWRRL